MVDIPLYCIISRYVVVVVVGLTFSLRDRTGIAAGSDVVITDIGEVADALR